MSELKLTYGNHFTHCAKVADVSLMLKQKGFEVFTIADSTSREAMTDITIAKPSAVLRKKLPAITYSFAFGDCGIVHNLVDVDGVSVSWIEKVVTNGQRF